MYKKSPLETYIREKRESKPILLMTHLVLGYPNFDDCYEMVKQMVEAGVDLIELQIPFSEPMADGPVILAANQAALDRQVTLDQCLDFAKRVTQDFPIPFLFMGYGNTFYRYGMEKMAQTMADIGLYGAIVPDLPPEESGRFPDPDHAPTPAPGQDYLGAMATHGQDPIHIFTPQTPEDRMAFLDTLSSGFIYCTARKGVTGADTQFSPELSDYLARCRAATRLPIAVGFGLKERADIEFLTGKADIAVMGSETLRVADRQGVGAVGDFINSLI